MSKATVTTATNEEDGDEVNGHMRGLSPFSKTGDGLSPWICYNKTPSMKFRGNRPTQSDKIHVSFQWQAILFSCMFIFLSPPLFFSFLSVFSSIAPSPSSLLSR